MSNNNSQSMAVHSATFVTQRGDRRVINFVRPSEAPSGTFPLNLKERKLQPGYETVWDVDRQAYRTFNITTVVGSVSTSTQSVTVDLF